MMTYQAMGCAFAPCFLEGYSPRVAVQQFMASLESMP